MKYTYAYKTPDGIRHEATMNAASRDEVFAELRRQGIKAIKVVAADGSKANGEVRGVRARVVVALVALAAIVAGVVAFFLGESNNRTTEQSNNSLLSPRHQIYGDPAVMEGFERGDFSSALARPGDRLLAIFAQPGKLMCAKGVDPRRLDPAAEKALSDYVKAELGADRDLGMGADDSREVRELKQIVNGLREELRGYLSNGNGTPRSFWRRLNERTREEMQIYERTRIELEKEKSQEVWDEKNAALRRLGLRTIMSNGKLKMDNGELAPGDSW